MQTRRVGIFTSAIALIAVGVTIILHQSAGMSYHVFKYLWPILIILYGIEAILVHCMRKDARVRYSGWSIVVLALVMLFSLGEFTAQSLPGIRIGPSYAEPVHGQVNIQNTGIRRVVIQLKNTPVTITGINSTTLSYEGVLKMNASSQSAAKQAIDEDWSVQQVGDTLDITLKDPTVGVIALGGTFQRSYLNVKLPEALMSKVVTSNSSVRVSQTDAATDIQTTNGAVIVKNIRANVTTHTSNGSITLTDVSGLAHLETTNGAIRAISAVRGDWTYSTTNGSIQIQLLDKVNASVTATTSNGHIGGNVPWQVDHREHRCTLGAGTYQISLRTSNGSVMVDRGN